MPTPTEHPTASLASINPQRVEDALARIGPKWTTWSTMLLAQENRSLRVRDFAALLPFVSEQLLGKRLIAMQADGLVIRDGNSRGAAYRLSALGESLAPVYRSLSTWSRSYLPTGRMAEANRVEDAIRRLRPRYTTAVVQLLSTNGPTGYKDMGQRVGLELAGSTYRFTRLQADGLITKMIPFPRSPYILTSAGQALGAVYASIEHWSEPLVAPQKPSPTPHTAAATRGHASVPLGTDDARTTAALRRSAAIPTALFSHAPQPQPRVPAAMTAQSAPSRAR
ncbi:winged helix-turn-helix transcriptional regulator [Streptomyces albidoflavus]